MSTPINFERIQVTIAQASVAQRITNEVIFTQQIEVHVKTGSTGPAYIGDSGVDATWIPRATGTTTTFTSSSGGDVVKGAFFDLSKLYLLSATAGDVVVIQYSRKEP